MAEKNTQRPSQDGLRASTKYTRLTWLTGLAAEEHHRLSIAIVPLTEQNDIDDSNQTASCFMQISKSTLR